MAGKSALHYIELSKGFIDSEWTKIKYRMCEKDFTRNRKLSFSELSLCMLRLLRQNIQIELHKYFSDLKGTLSKGFSFWSSYL